MFPSHAAFRKLSLSHTLFWSFSALHFVIPILTDIHWFPIEGSFLFWSTLFLSQHGLYLLTLSISFLSALHLRLLWSDINRLPDRQSSTLTNPHTGLNSFYSCHANCICSCELLVHWFNNVAHTQIMAILDISMQLSLLPQTTYIILGHIPLSQTAMLQLWSYFKKQLCLSLTLLPIAWFSTAMASVDITRSALPLAIVCLSRWRAPDGCNSQNYSPRPIACRFHPRLTFIYLFSYFIIEESSSYLTTRL